MTTTATGSNLRTFAIDFFSHFGAEVYPDDADVLVVLPPPLAKTFGKPRLYLTFADDDSGAGRELSPEQDLLSFGSRIFDQMVAMLAGRGEQAAMQMPQQQAMSLLPPPDPRAPAAVRGTLETGIDTKPRPFFVFHFRADYVWTQKEDTLLTVVLDGAGQVRAEKTALFRRSPGPHTDPPPEPVDAAAMRAMFRRAQDEAGRQVEARADALEAGIREQMGAVVRRLTGFYARLLAELDDGDESDEIRRDLESDLQRKLADELERHRLRVTLSPVSRAVVWLPLAEHRWQVPPDSGQSAAQLFLRRDLFSGHVECFRCEACGRELADIAFAPEPRGETCPVRRPSVAWALLWLVGLPAAPADVPAVSGFPAQQAEWRRVVLPSRTIFLGVRPGWSIAHRLWPRALLIDSPHERIVWRQSWGRWRRVSPR